MKRRVASLPPVSLAVFNQKVLERHSETNSPGSQNLMCDICSKSYTTDGAYRSHINSKRHKDTESKITAGVLLHPTKRKSQAPPVASTDAMPESEDDDGMKQDDDDKAIDAKIAAAEGKRLSPVECLFCPSTASTFEENLTHMSTVHSFFVPDAEFLTDLTGLVGYLAEKLVVGNVCIYCGSKSRDFRSLEAVRKHMIDKSHCKVAYDTEDDRLEVSDYYDFTSSYPINGEGEDEGWEDLDDDEDGVDVDEVVDEAVKPKKSNDEPSGQITYGDSDYELVLPSGARIGHRSMRRYYAQSFSPVPSRRGEDPNSGAALVRRLIADKNSALVPRKGGFGAYGAGTDVIKARNIGEAREAGRHVKEFRDQRRREEFKTKVGFKHNQQKHYRDPLLQ